MSGVAANSSTAEMPEKQSYLKRLALGFMSATIVSVPLSMGVTIFDRSVVQVVNGSKPSVIAAVGDGFKTLFRNPINTFLKVDNRVVFLVYGSTYLTKNSMEATSNYQNWNPFWPVLLGTTCVNTSLGIFKDKYLAQLFGSGVVNFPMTSYAFFTARDMVIIGASFNGPPVLAPILQEKTGWQQETCETVAQLACPGMAQIFATPLHILGLDMYNRPTVSWGEHCKGLLRRTLDPLGVRMCRQIYVFGVGSIAVKKMSRWLGFYEPTEVSSGVSFMPANLAAKNV